MWLNIDVFSTEKRSGAIARDLFHFVHKFATAVVTMTGIAFGILVGQYTSNSLHDRRAGEIFTGDHLKAILLPGLLRGNRCPDVWVVHFDEIHWGFLLAISVRCLRNIARVNFKNIIEDCTAIHSPISLRIVRELSFRVNKQHPLCTGKIHSRFSLT
jgi:hypothetical protein